MRMCHLRLRFMRLTLVSSILLFTAGLSANPSHHQPYAGEQNREIKSLSTTDIDDLVNGRGWGFAKAAELNGLPGPAHLLEYSAELDLNQKQIISITRLYEKMQQQAKLLGQGMVDLERKLNNGFVSGDLQEQSLKQLLSKIADVRAQLRFVHLSTHLQTPAILTDLQIAHYQELRGYSGDKNPCDAAPADHDAESWRLHNDC